MGVLTEQGGPDWHPAPPELQHTVKAAVAFCRERGVDLTELALRFCFDHSRVSTTLVGMSTTEQVRASLRAFGSPADPELMREVKTIIAPVANIVWPSGKPENN